MLIKNNINLENEKDFPETEIYKSERYERRRLRNNA
jgi:hypothetical protein